MQMPFLNSTSNRESKTVFFILCLWVLINLLQAAFTELAHDEAYYWMYSRYLDAGYFDHPPAIALLIKIGYALSPNELGVRFLIVFLNAGTLFFTYQLCNKKNFLLYALLFSSISIFHFYGFIAVPDVALLFFSALFFFLYRRYLDDDKLLSSVMLGLVVAALLYSKYHGLLLLFFTLLSNLSLLKKGSFYLAILVAILVYVPHIYWQIANNYPSYQYHVLSKSQDPYHVKDTLDFILGQLLISGPFIGFILFYSTIRYRMKNRFERALKFSFWGMLLFFLFSTLNARVEPNWMAAALIPALVLAYNYISETQKLKKWSVGFCVLSLSIFLLFRINLVFELFPKLNSKVFPEFYGWEKWAKEIKNKSGNTPVVFSNSYQKASKYSFYSGDLALSLNNTSYRRNQFDLWNIAEKLQGKRVVYIPNWDVGPRADFTFESSKGQIQFVRIRDFRSFSKINVLTDKARFCFAPNQRITLPIELVNNFTYPIQFGSKNSDSIRLVCDIFKEETFYGQKTIERLNGQVLQKTTQKYFSFTTPAEEGTYYLQFAIQVDWLPPGINSRLIQMKIQKKRQN